MLLLQRLVPSLVVLVTKEDLARNFLHAAVAELRMTSEFL